MFWSKHAACFREMLGNCWNFCEKKKKAGYISFCWHLYKLDLLMEKHTLETRWVSEQAEDYNIIVDRDTLDAPTVTLAFMQSFLSWKWRYSTPSLHHMLQVFRHPWQSWNSNRKTYKVWPWRWELLHIYHLKQTQKVESSFCGVQSETDLPPQRKETTHEKAL